MEGVFLPSTYGTFRGSDHCINLGLWYPYFYTEYLIHMVMAEKGVALL